MAGKIKKRIATGYDIPGWMVLALGLAAAFILDKRGPPYKWHAAIMWTILALVGVLIFPLKKRRPRLFLIFCATCLVLHVFAMWIIFGRLLPRLILGTLYVVPIAFVESIFLVVIFARLERKLTPEHHKRSGESVEH